MKYAIRTMIQYVWIIPLLPLLGVLINTFFGAALPRKTAAWLAAALVGIGAALSLGIIWEIRNIPDFHGQTITIYRWLTTGAEGGTGVTQLFNVNIAFYVDQLSALMLMVVTGVGFFIHMYSIGYMEHDPGIRRYFIYLNLFIFAMLMLVLGDSYLLLFLGWEGVGLCSYLLISFWYTDHKNADAGRKAFIVNRIGDFAVLLGMFLVWTTFGTLTYGEVFEQAPQASAAVLTLITLLFFIGCTGKSAQIPLFVWLPDAMAGPTPVSALIHAATMVTAGVYLLVRSAPLLEAQHIVTPEIIAWIGVLTALFAGTVALTQTDIKKVLAYSTVSQLGYMFLAVGAGAYVAAVFHLFTHAFFKALLFLGSGSVMHAMEHGHHHVTAHAHPPAEATAHDSAGDGHGQADHDHAHGDTHDDSHGSHGAGNFDVQDMRNMGGLWKRAPHTAWTFLFGALALAGFPLTSGFFSKDEILTLTQHAATENPTFTILWIIGLITAFITAFYSFRQFFMVFTGAPRTEAAEHASESPAVMTIPLWFLAIFALLGGLAFGFPPEAGLFHHWIEPVVEEFVHHGEGLAAGQISTILAFVISGVIALAGIGLAYLMYGSRVINPASISNALKPLYTGSLNKWYIDELYQATFVRFYNWLSRASAFFVDKLIIDGAVNGVGALFGGLSGVFSRFQTGYVRGYAMSIIIGLLLIAGFLVWQVDFTDLVPVVGP